MCVCVHACAYVAWHACQDQKATPSTVSQRQGREVGYLFSNDCRFGRIVTFPSVVGEEFQRETTFDYVNTIDEDNSKHYKKELAHLVALCVSFGLYHAEH